MNPQSIFRILKPSNKRWQNTSKLEWASMVIYTSLNSSFPGCNLLFATLTVSTLLLLSKRHYFGYSNFCPCLFEHTM